jgi:hypothetical protein
LIFCLPLQPKSCLQILASTDMIVAAKLYYRTLERN